MCAGKKLKFISVPLEKEVDYSKCEKLTSLMKRTVDKRKELGIRGGGMAVIDFQLRVEKLVLECEDKPVIWFKYRKFRNYLVPKHIADKIYNKLTRNEVI